jgi:hypothetical protein
MCVQNTAKTSILLVFFVFTGIFLCSCEGIENILPSSGTYKINVQINGISLSECSYTKSTDKITLRFEEPVTGDPDVTALMVFLKNPLGDVAGWKVIYALDEEAENKETRLGRREEERVTGENTGENEDEISDDDAEETPVIAEVETPESYQDGDELIVTVLSLDDELPSFPIPENLSMGKYTLVFQVMSGKDILQKTEKNIFYLGKTVFSYEGINVYLPGLSGTSQLIPRGTVVMLEANLKFDKRLDPYIVWYDGKNKLNEGNFSDGAGYMFWKAPEQSGFYSLRAEIFPVENFNELTGYKKEISLLVSSKTTDIHLVSANITQLTNWYVMEGNLNDSKSPASSERALRPASGARPKAQPKWMGSDGTYGLATGYNNILTLPAIPVRNKETEIWQILFRFKPLNNGNIFSVQFGSSSGISMVLHIEEKNLVLTLISPLETVSQTVRLSSAADESSENVQTAEQYSSFLTTGVNFSIHDGLLAAQINVINLIPGELAVKPITLEAEIKNEFHITLGFLENAFADQLQAPVGEIESSAKQVKTGVLPEYTALWDEFALYYMPPIDMLAVTVKPETSENKPVITPEN